MGRPRLRSCHLPLCSLNRFLFPVDRLFHRLAPLCCVLPLPRECNDLSLGFGNLCCSLCDLTRQLLDLALGCETLIDPTVN